MACRMPFEHFLTSSKMSRSISLRLRIICYHHTAQRYHVMQVQSFCGAIVKICENYFHRLFLIFHECNDLMPFPLLKVNEYTVGLPLPLFAGKTFERSGVQLNFYGEGLVCIKNIGLVYIFLYIYSA